VRGRACCHRAEWAIQYLAAEGVLDPTWDPACGSSDIKEANITTLQELDLLYDIDGRKHCGIMRTIVKTTRAASVEIIKRRIPRAR